MAITATAPYAPAAGIIAVLDRYRETGLGDQPVTAGLVRKMSVGGDEIARRIVLSMKELGLIDDDGNPLGPMSTYKQAPSHQYRELFAAHLFDVYAPVFAIAGRDFSDKTPGQIEDAFRDFKPDSLRKRMVTCFTGLCEHAGIVKGVVKSKPGPKVGAAVQKRARGRSSGEESHRTRPSNPPPAPVPGELHTTKATLASGGTVTLSVTVNLMELDGADRSFVFDLIDRVKGYGDRPALTVGSESSGEVSTS